MYVEERMYTLNPGTAPEYLNYDQNPGMKVQLNMIVHMWGYESLDQRERCRAAMSADPGWRLKKMLAAVR